MSLGNQSRLTRQRIGLPQEEVTIRLNIKFFKVDHRMW